MLANLLEFINTLSIDEKLYWRVASANSKEAGFEITWRRGDRPKPWSLMHKGNGTTNSYCGKEFEHALKSAGVDLDDFERQIGVSALTQAVFADMVLQSAIQLFGAEVVTRSINDTRAFLAQVSEMAHQHAGTRSQSPAGVRATHRPRLRLVNAKLH